MHLPIKPRKPDDSPWKYDGHHGTPMEIPRNTIACTVLLHRILIKFHTIPQTTTLWIVHEIRWCSTEIPRWIFVRAGYSQLRSKRKDDTCVVCTFFLSSTLMAFASFNNTALPHTTSCIARQLAS